MRFSAHIVRCRTILALAGLLVALAPLPAGAAAPVLVSHDAAGNPGNANSGLIMPLTSSQGFYAQALDSGKVLFVSQAALAAADTNQIHDFYECGADGTVRVISLPQGTGAGPCMWGQADTDDTTGLVLRQAIDPNVWTLQYGALASIPDPLPFLKVTRLDFAGNGQTVAYAVDNAGTTHVLLRNLVNGAEVTLSQGANGSSSYPVASGDGKRVAFVSAAYNLVAGDTDGVDDVFLADQSANPATITLISQRSGSTGSYWPALTPAISGDGLTVAFVSQDANFVLDDTNGKADVFIAVSPFDQRPLRISVSASGTQADQDALDPKLSQTGRFVVFRSKATTLVSGAAGAASQVYLVDRELGTIECLSRSTGNVEANADCLAPNLSPSGRYVTFVSAATNLATGTPAAKYQVYRVDRGPNWANHPPKVSGLSFSMLRGQPVTFSLTATDVDGDTLTYTPTTVPGANIGTLKDKNGTVIVVSEAYGASRFPWTFTPANASVKTASFQFRANDGIASSAPAEVRFLDSGQGAIERMSVSTAGREGADDSGSNYPFSGLSISFDGGAILFSSKANLSADDSDAGTSDIYLRIPQNGVTSLLSWRSDIGITDSCLKPVLSGDGTVAMFVLQTDHAIYRLNRPTDAGGRIVTPTDYPGGPVVSQDSTRIVYTNGGTATVLNTTGAVVESFAAAGCADPAVSADGQVIAFASTDPDLVSGGNPGAASCIFWKRIGVNALYIISRDGSGSLLAGAAAPVLSMTGRFAAFLAPGTDTKMHLYRRNVGTNEILDLATDASNPAMSADGRFLYFVRNSQAYRYDTAAPAATQPVLLSHAPDGTAGDGNCGVGALSATGQYTAFASSSSNLVNGDTNRKWDVFRADLGAPANVLPTPSLRSMSVNEDQALSGIPISYTDPEGNDAEFRLVSAPQHAKANGFALHDLKPGEPFITFDYRPQDHFYGTDTFVCQYGDVGGWSDPVTVTITVNEVNDPPVLAAVANQAGYEGQVLDVALTATDPDMANPDAGHRDTLTFSVASGPGTVQNGHWVYTPGYTVASRANSPVVQPVVIQVADSRGLTARQSFSVTVTNQPHAPVIQMNGRLVLVGNQTTASVTTSMVQVSDLDYANAAPPPANIRLTLVSAPGKGNLTDRNGNPLVAGSTLLYSDFPLAYTATGVPVFALDAASFKAKDLIEDLPGMESSTKQLDIVTGAQVQNLVLEKGWNLISFSMTPAFPDPAALFTVNGQSVLSGPVWRWDVVGRQFLQVQQAKPGEGYWVNSTQTITLQNLPGKPVASGLIQVVAGWNLVGPVGPGSSVACPPGCNAWWWLPKSRAFTTSPDSLKSGSGYFLHVPGDGTAAANLWLP